MEKPTITMEQARAIIREISVILSFVPQPAKPKCLVCGIEHDAGPCASAILGATHIRPGLPERKGKR